MAREIRTCMVCGANFSATSDSEFCPVCMLRRALAGGAESSESFSGDAVDSTPQEAAQRLEHYELVTDKDGQPVELGRGAMGVTYKAFDVDLRCPVTLKVISEKYLGDEATRLRFLREARACWTSGPIVSDISYHDAAKKRRRWRPGKLQKCFN